MKIIRDLITGIVGMAVLILMVIMVVGIFAVSLIFQRYHSAGEGTDIRNYKEYGEPAKSLYTSRYLFSFHKDYLQ